MVFENKYILVEASAKKFLRSQDTAGGDIFLIDSYATGRSCKAKKPNSKRSSAGVGAWRRGAIGDCEVTERRGHAQSGKIHAIRDPYHFMAVVASGGGHSGVHNYSGAETIGYNSDGIGRFQEGLLGVAVPKPRVCEGDGGRGARMTNGARCVRSATTAKVRAKEARSFRACGEQLARDGKCRRKRSRETPRTKT